MTVLFAYYDLLVLQNTPLDYSRVITDTDGNLVPLAGYTAEMMIRADADENPAATLTTGNGKITIDIPTSTVTLSLTQAETLAIEAKKYKYDLLLVNGSSINEPVIAGDFMVSRVITRS